MGQASRPATPVLSYGKRFTETPARLALAVADANWFTTENLFREVRRNEVATLLLKCMDYRNAWQHGQRPWSWGEALRELGPGLCHASLSCPPAG